MKINIAPGKYIIAVSGGVDSVALLDILTKFKDVELIVAHYNHGIREDSDLDENLVRESAAKYRLLFESANGDLGGDASEQLAREKRYEFLFAIKDKFKADAIITAHHQDDLLETALINIIRGTGYRGLTSIIHNPNILRPLLNTPKAEVLEYANQHKLNWREDSTNEEEEYLRNYIRKNVMSQITNSKREKLLNDIKDLAESRKESDVLITKISQKILKNNEIDRSKFSLLPNDIGNELVMFWLRKIGITDFDRKTIERLSLALKTGAPNTRVNVHKNTLLILSSKKAHFKTEVL
jgi:tRNA(Ile)-lysidine synthase